MAISPPPDELLAVAPRSCDPLPTRSYYAASGVGQGKFLLTFPSTRPSVPPAGEQEPWSVVFALADGGPGAHNNGEGTGNNAIAFPQGGRRNHSCGLPSP